MVNHSEQLSEDEKSREIKNKEQREAHYNLFKTGAEVIKEAMLRAGIESDCTYFRYIYAVVSHFIQNDIEQNKWRASNSKGDFQETLRWEIDRIDRIVDTVSFESDKRSEKDKTAFFWFRCDGIFNYELARFMTKLSSKKNKRDFVDLGISDTDRDDHETIGIPKFKKIIEDFEGFKGFQSIGHIEDIEGLAYSRAIGEDFGFKILDRLLIDIILAHTITKYILILREFLHEDPALRFLFKYKRSAIITILVDRHGALGIGKADLPIRVLLPMPGGLHYKFYKFDHVLQIALTLSRIYAQLPSKLVPAAPSPVLNCAWAPTSARRPDDALEWVMESERFPNAEFGKPYKCDTDFVSASHIKSQLENAFHMGAEIPNSLFLLLDKIIKEDGLL